MKLRNWLTFLCCPVCVVAYFFRVTVYVSCWWWSRNCFPHTHVSQRVPQTPSAPCFEFLVSMQTCRTADLTYSFDLMTFIWPCDLSRICSCLPTSEWGVKLYSLTHPCGSLCCGTRFLEMLGSKNYFTFFSVGFCSLVCDYTTRLRKSGFICIYFLYYSLPSQSVHLLEIYIVSYCIPKSIIFLV